MIGLGGVGLAALLAARMLEASPIVAIDLNDDKLATARRFGATAAFNAADPECVDKVRAASGGGVDYAFEMAGSSRALELAYRITRRGGTTVSAGLPHPQQQVTLQHVSLVAEERTLKGSYLGSCVPERDIPRYIEWYRAGALAGRPVAERAHPAARHQCGVRPARGGRIDPAGRRRLS